MHSQEILMIGTLPPEIGSKNYGGVARVVWNLALSLQKEGKNLKIGGIGRYFKKYQVKEGIEIYGIGFSPSVLFKAIEVILKKRALVSSFSARNFGKLLYAVYYLLYLEKKISFDVIHVHHVINQIPLAARMLGLRVKIIATIHSYSTLIHDVNSKEKKNINLQLQQVDHITHVSRHLRNTGIKKGIKWPCDDHVIYNGITISTPDSNKPDKRHGICFVGSVTKQKGIDRLINSLEYLTDDISVTIIGSGNDATNVKKIAQERNYDIKLLGQLSHAEALQKMSGCKLLVNPSLSESFGLVYLEALMVGTPVVGYQPMLSEFKEALGGHAFLDKWLVEFDAIKENSLNLSEKIKSGIETTKAPEYAKQEALIRQEIRKEFCWEKIVKKYINLYDNI